MNRYLCIHGHFYQPPRENPWLEAIEQQDSAYPFHDWNERITDECYEPNAFSRILTGEGKIIDIVNNYSRISFNFGPTLLSWMEFNAPAVYQAIQEADRQSRKRYGGHGSAIAQAYNHMIMPLANRADKVTQVLWGIADFERRFNRKPEGMWLPETAVDLESLDILAEHGIAFTILAPNQAKAFRKMGEADWISAEGSQIDPKRAYQVKLDSGRAIAVFFYDGPISQGVAFEGLLKQGETFAHRLVGGFDDANPGIQLMHIATDGETYGHHHRFGDMALAYALRYVQDKRLAHITNYAQFLSKHPPEHEAQVFEQSAWSCAHGVGRWMTHCGCNAGRGSGWTQEWRGPLRDALNWLRDRIAPRFEEAARELLQDPWAARNAYIHLILDRSDGSREAFFKKYGKQGRELAEPEKVRALKLLEMQRYAMLMYTSCGWFFDEISGIETVQCVQYASRALQLAQEVFQTDLESEFAGLLEKARSNIPEHANGRTIYERFVKPAQVGLDKVMAHYAGSSLFHDYGENKEIYCYRITVDDSEVQEAGAAKFSIGHARVQSRITLESAEFVFSVLHLGDQNVTGGVKRYAGPEDFKAIRGQLADIFRKGDLQEVIRQMDHHFREFPFSLKTLFRDQQREIIGRILKSTMEDADRSFRQLYERYAPLMHFLGDLAIPLPKAFFATSEFVINNDLKDAICRDVTDPEQIRRLLEDAALSQIHLDEVRLGRALEERLRSLAQSFVQEPADPERLARLNAGLDTAAGMPFPVNLFRVQNIFYRFLKGVYPELKASPRLQAIPDYADQVGRAAAKLYLQIPQ